MTNTKKKVILLLVIAVLIAIIPLFALRGAEFSGSDDAGSKAISEITGKEYKPWAKPIMETLIGRELPGEVESLMFSVQTGIGVGIICFYLGRLVERHKKEKVGEKSS